MNLIVALIAATPMVAMIVIAGRDLAARLTGDVRPAGNAPLASV